jgi:putative transposase
MPRLARTVFAEVPHHITQRGNRRGDVFFDDEDYQTYLEWLHYYSKQHQLEILAYCLMTNHVHFVAVPGTESSLQQVLKPLHMRYAQRINRRNRWKGHFWQGRYFSSPMDERYMWSAIRYVERNPVRARMVRKAERYPWSSAAGHCGLTDDYILTTLAKWKKLTEQVDNWSAWLAEGDDDSELGLLRRNIEKGLPCGSDRFINKLERLAGRSLQFKAQGRPKHEE